ncbi:MAG TPA: 50S ribosomal protein L25 [Gemmatimonadales bacterium]|jgi:large subunit ribosomal protein L25|nr:50S ribosomal protein L25 [Gemmatimonadales bacterium]
MQHLNLAAESRTNTGKGPARALRRAGKIPAVLYGHSIAARSLAVDHQVFAKVLDLIGGEAALLDVSIDGEAPIKALVREVQRNPVRRSDVIHLDLYAIVENEPITVEVPVHIIGTAEGVRNQGGVLDHHLHRITLRVLPADIPDHIEVDVTNLTVGHAIHISDIVVPKGEIMNDGTVSVVSVVVSRAEVSAEPVATGATEPEVIKKGKPEDAEAEGEAGAKAGGKAEAKSTGK